MGTTIYENHGIQIRRYSRGKNKGIGYQITPLHRYYTTLTPEELYQLYTRLSIEFDEYPPIT